MLEWVISSAILLLVIIALRFALKGRISLRLQYALWGLVLLRLLVPVSLGSTGLSIGNLTRKAAETETVQTIAGIARSELPRMSYRAAYDDVADEYAARGVDISEIPEADFSETVEYEILDRMSGTKTIAEVLMCIWGAGAAAVAIVLAASNIRFAVRLKKARRRLDGQTGSLPVYVSAGLDTPCLFGLFRPAVYVTPEAASDAVLLRHAVEHELTHYHHGDHVWSLLRGVCLALHWFDPLVWWAAVLSRRDSELACDEATVKRLGESERAAYGRTLIEMTCRKRPALLLTATTMTGGRSSIRERILMIAKKPKTAVYTLIAVILIIAVAAGCTFTGAKDSVPSSDVPQGTAEPDSSGQNENDGSTATSPADFVDELFASGDVGLTLYLANEGAQNTCPAGEWYAGRFKVLMSCYEWTSLPMPLPEPSLFWLTAVSADGTESMTFWANGGAGMVQYEDGSEPRFWSAKAADGSGGSIANDVRFEFYNLEVDHSRISFSLDGSAEDAADFFVHNAYGSHMMSLSSGSAYGMSDYEVIEWNVLRVSETDDAVVGMFQCAFTPQDFDSPAIWAGNTDYGTGQYQGKLTWSREFVLQKQDDGCWHCIDLGTGGAALPE